MRERLRRLPAGNAVIRGTVLLLGAFFIVLGLVAIVLPGPFTIPPLLLGLAIWSLEFDFAKRLLQRVKERVRWRKTARSTSTPASSPPCSPSTGHS